MNEARPHRWLAPVRALLVVGGSFLVADTANAVLAAALGGPAPGRPAARPALPAARVPSLEHFLGVIAGRNVFLHGEPIPGEEVAAAAPDDTLPEEGCTLPLQVLASVFVPRDPSLSLATFLDTGAKKIVVAQVGERVLDRATLVEVQEPWDEERLRKESVAIFETDEGSRVVCRSDDAPAPAPARFAKGPAGVPTGAGIKRLADGQYEIPQSEIDAVMNGGLATIATTVRIVPYFEGGKSAGFKMYSIKPGSLLSKIGLVSGDVLRKVNGYEISSPEKALEVYGILKSERNVTLDITRGGKPRTFQYSIR